MNKILYISLTGMTEPLGRSQVLEYLIDLSKKGNDFYLISFEREKDLKDIEEVKKIIEENNIKWEYFIYKKNKFKQLKEIYKVVKHIKKLNKKENFQIFHTRSFLPTLIGFLSKRKNIKIIFDIRGFWIDEKLDSGRMKSTFLYKILKKIDDYLYKNADHVVTLTHKAKDILSENLKIHNEKITVIPTCANKEIFQKIDNFEKEKIRKEFNFTNDDILLIHTGTVSGWYDFDKELKLIKYLINKNENIKFIILNKNEHDFINKKLQEYKIDKSKVILKSVPFEKVSQFLNISDYSIFFIKPSYSKQASAPTKFAENVACHLPSITNKGVGDMEYYLTQYKVGKLIDLENINYEEYEEILKFIEKPDINENDFEKLFNEHFDKKMAVKKYDNIYKRLINE